MVKQLSSYSQILNELRQRFEESDNMSEDLLLSLESEIANFDENRFITDRDRFEHLLKNVLENDKVAIIVFYFAVIRKYIPNLNKGIATLFGTGICVKSGCLLCGIKQPSFILMKNTFERLCKIFPGMKQSYPIFDAEFEADERLMQYLCASDLPDERIAKFTNLNLTTGESFDDINSTELSYFLKSKMELGMSIWLLGMQDDTNSVKRCCTSVGRCLISVDASSLNMLQISLFTELIFREALLYDAYIYITDVEKADVGVVYTLIMQAIKDKIPIITGSFNTINLLQMTERNFFIYDAKSTLSLT